MNVVDKIVKYLKFSKEGEYKLVDAEGVETKVMVTADGKVEEIKDEVVADAPAETKMEDEVVADAPAQSDSKVAELEARLAELEKMLKEKVETEVELKKDIEKFKAEIDMKPATNSTVVKFSKDDEVKNIYKTKLQEAINNLRK